MQKAVAYGYGILLAIALSGCGKASADAVVKELLAAENANVDLAAEGRQGKFDWDKMNRIGQRLVDLNAQLAAMPQDEVDAAKKKYKDEFLKLAERRKKLDSGIKKLKPAGPN